MEFSKFFPGLVGGHCLPVDPFYLYYLANKKNIKQNLCFLEDKLMIKFHILFKKK